mmetsp:Transcript_4333/g.6504  ORF Transcript_4333/g.6504 Transcript_4333/m.6504 type:complete len:452 (+) Transcript_4333:103-1458(+)
MSASSAAVQVSPEDLKKEHLNVVFIGHVDVGKSTLSGQILYLSGQVDERTIQKYEREAKEKNRQSWWLAFIMDTNEEERAKGKTVEVGRAPFVTATKRYTILDAPGHAKYVPNMISGAAQADVGVLVISARRSEFESGFNRGGQTREHAMLAMTLGVRRLIVAINKMDEETVEWSEERFNEIKDKLTPFLRKQGFKPKKQVAWVPISAFTGANVVEQYKECKWYTGPSLMQILDGLSGFNRKPDDALRVPVFDRFKDRGSTTALGKVESGTLNVGDKVVLMPNNVETEVTGIELDLYGDVDTAPPGENVQIKLKGVSTKELGPGMVLCSPESVTPVGDILEAQMMIRNISDVFSAGYTCVLHIHTVTVEVEVKKIQAILDPKTGKKLPKRCTFVENGALISAILQTDRPICVETFQNYQQLGRFTLRSGGNTVAQGKVTRIGDSSKKRSRK